MEANANELKGFESVKYLQKSLQVARPLGWRSQAPERFET
jgi:hypothetical protein